MMEWNGLFSLYFQTQIRETRWFSVQTLGDIGRAGLNQVLDIYIRSRWYWQPFPHGIPPISPMLVAWPYTTIIHHPCAILTCWPHATYTLPT